MRSVKPGRGPSAMGAIGGIFGVVFGVFWTILASLITTPLRMMGGPLSLIGYVFPLFGVIFVIAGIASVLYNLNNATSKDRLSIVDITTDKEEPDPLNQIFGERAEENHGNPHEPVEDRLARLLDLKEKGLISGSEYNSQRQRVLNEI